MNKITKNITIKAEKKEDRVLRFVGSDQSIDRDGDRMMATGWDIKNYKKNPVVLFGHDQRAEAVARTKKVWVDHDKNQLLFDIEFPEAEISSKGDSLYKLYKNGFMFATSVSFSPNYDKIEYPKKKEGSKLSRIFHEQELLEISLVSVPANARALLTSKSINDAIDKDIVCKEEIEELLSAIKDKEAIDKGIEEEPETMDYGAEIKILKEEIEELKSGSYLYSLFDKDKSFADEIFKGVEAEEKAEDALYDEIMKELE